MNSIKKKKIVAGTMAAGVILGGGWVGVLHNQAYAAESTNTTADAASPNKAEHGKHKGFGHETHMIKEAATILGVDEKTVIDQLKQGKTLAQISQDKGVSEEVLLQKLTEAENQSIDAAVAAGKITQAQADKHKSGLADRLKKEVESTVKHVHHEKGRFEPFADRAVLSQILGVTQQELAADLKAGKSLSEIAQAKGIEKDQLVSKIKDSMTDKISKFVDKKA